MAPAFDPDDSAALRAERRKLESLLELGRAIYATNDVLLLAGKVLDIAIEVTGAERGILYLLEGESAARRPVPKVWRVLSDETLDISEAVLGETLEIEAPVVATEPAPGPPDGDSHETELRSILCVPLRSREGPLGALYLDARAARGRFGVHEIDLVSAFAAQAGLAIENARAIGELERANRRLRETQTKLIQSAKMSAIGQLAAGISHEVRNPLNVISGSIYFLRELLRAHPEAKVHEHLGHIESEVKRAAALTEKLLHVARPGEKVRDTALAQKREVFVRDAFRENRDDVVPVDVVRLPRQPAPRVDGKGERVEISGRAVVLARRPAHPLVSDCRLRTQAAGKRLHGDAATDPAIGLVARVHRFVLPTHGTGDRRRPPVNDDAAVDGHGHVADHTRAL